MRENEQDLAEWFSGRPGWLQEAARRLFANGILAKKDADELTVLCKREAGIVVPGFPDLKAGKLDKNSFGQSQQKVNLRLDSIGDISGINALAPRTPLEFQKEPLTLVYGVNGAGKSGYTRILKQCSGGRGSAPLHGDVFHEMKKAQKCTIRYTLDGASHEIEWIPEMEQHDHLRHLSLYDTAAANVYVDSENEVSYEPFVLGCFRVLVDISEKISESLGKEITAKPSRKPSLPQEYLMTVAGNWYEQITHATKDQEISNHAEWTEENEEQIQQLADRLREKNPLEKAKSLRKTKGQVQALKKQFEDCVAILNDNAFQTLLTAKGDAATKRSAADTDVKRAFEGAPLDGIGTESWKLLWEQARIYSEKAAYPGVTFPNVADDAVCVLCQQPLESAGRERLSAFQTFVTSNLELQARDSETIVQQRIKAVEDCVIDASIEDKLDLCEITDEAAREKIKQYARELIDRRQCVLTASALSELTPMPNRSAVDALGDLELALETQATAFDEDAKTNKRSEHERNERELKAKKWASEQKVAIQSEITRQKEIRLLEKAKSSANTKALSGKKSTLAEELITSAFVKRFERELAALGASRVKVTIEKTRSPKGQVLHEIKLVGNKTGVRAIDVLSEGEFRIVSLAAFLADVDTGESAAAFIFDDPISSLDQDFEEATAERLIKLCGTRQVIVFTHRLSLLAMLEDAADKADIECRTISLQRESWGTGQPAGAPLPAQKPQKALNSLLNERLAKARKVWNEVGSQAYAVEAKALCSDIRITIERLIELELLADVVQRFRRPINTMGKIGKLAFIEKADCELIDEMMTKYSRYEHAQPKEAPVSLPEPDELEADLKRLQTWQAEFSKRATV